MIARIPYWLRAGGILILLYAMGLALLLNNALSGSGQLFLFAFTTCACLLLGLRPGLAAAVLCTGTLAITGLLMTGGQLAMPPVAAITNSTNLASWLIASAVFLLLGIVVVIPLATLKRALELARDKEHKLTAELETQRLQLDTQVQQRTHDTQQRLRQIHTASDLVQASINSHDLRELLEQAVRLIADRFGYAQVEIYLTNPDAAYPELKAYAAAAPSEDHYPGERLSTEEQAHPGWTIVHQQAWLDPPDSSASSGQPGWLRAGIPLISGIQTMGALTLSANSPQPYSPDVLRELQSLASQIAAAVQSRQLQASTQVNLENKEKQLKFLQTLDTVSHAVSIETDLNALYQVIHQQVARVLGNGSFMIALYHQDTGLIEIPYAYESGEKMNIPAFPLGQGLTSLLIRTGQPLLLKENVAQQAAGLGALMMGKEAKSWLGVPLMVAGQAIGAMIVQDLERENQFNTDDQQLLATMASQIAVVVRNARLLEISRQKADREALINSINDKIRRSIDMQTVLKTTAGELGRALGASRAFIQVGLGTDPVGSNGSE